MIMIVISFALVKSYAFAILYVLIFMQIKLVVVVVVEGREKQTGRSLDQLYGLNTVGRERLYGTFISFHKILITY